MSCNQCCPPVIVSGGSATPCLSTDPGNAITTGTDGCLYVPPVPDLAPDACNSAQNTPDGLLVPRTDLTAVTGAAPAATGTDRSVDVDVVQTPGCPTVWAVGARLTPPSGFRNAERGHADLLAAQGTDVPVPESDIVLPEVGTYHIDTDVRYALGTDTGGSGYIIGHLRDETAGTLLASFTQIAAINSPSAQEHQGGTTHIMTEHTITSAPRTVRLHLMFVWTGGTISAAAAGGTDSNGATRMRFLKVRD
ncbi:hypothetical protein [Streptomyces taklimakanensis]|uniref:hypothetical protein n=1 Tax=Streptomyces taklimakanensis TaxID=2569853 RepID=UPI001EE4650A|nr:hypothetical protein [Streptomyces taklimakanensis]